METAPLKFYVFSRAMIEAIAPHEEPHLIISVTSAVTDQARLRAGALRRGVLRLSFLDADAPTAEMPEEQLFSNEQAAKVWSFVANRPADVTLIVVHCDAGVSRSAGIAAALAKVFLGDDTEFFGGRYRPNRRVYRAVLEAALGPTV
jgi:predicted protein tyrosine phosphatase